MSKIQRSKINIIYKRYKIQKHGKEVQGLVDKYLIPSYISRLGIKPEEREFYAKVEDVLDTQSAFNPKFEANSYVSIDQESGRIIGCALSYIVTRDFYKNNFVDINKKIGSDESYPEHIRKYARHRYVVCHDLIQLFDDHNVKDMIYYESTIIHPGYRGSALNLDLLSKVDSGRGRYGILFEGMIPPGKSQHGIGLVPGDYNWKPIGCKLLKCLYSYDGYVIPVWFIPPKIEDKIVHDLNLKRKSKL